MPMLAGLLETSHGLLNGESCVPVLLRRARGRIDDALYVDFSCYEVLSPDGHSFPSIPLGFSVRWDEEGLSCSVSWAARWATARGCGSCGSGIVGDRIGKEEGRA